MERIVLVVNAHKPDAASIEFGTRMASLSGSKLTGLFLEHIYYEPVLLSQPEVFQYSTYLLQTGEVASIRADIDKAVSMLREQCVYAGVALDVIVEKTDPVEQTVYESRFADYLIVDPGLACSHLCNRL